MINFKEFVSVDATKKVNRRGGIKGSLTMICSQKNGKRLMLSEELSETLKLEDTVSLGFIKNTLILGKHLPGDNNVFELKESGKKRIIYSSEVVRIIAEKQNISFEGKVSHTWYKPSIEEYENSPIALFEPEVKEDE